MPGAPRPPASCACGWVLRWGMFGGRAGQGRAHGEILGKAVALYTSIRGPCTITTSLLTCHPPGPTEQVKAQAAAALQEERARIWGEANASGMQQGKVSPSTRRTQSMLFNVLSKGLRTAGSRAGQGSSTTV